MMYLFRDFSQKLKKEHKYEKLLEETEPLPSPFTRLSHWLKDLGTLKCLLAFYREIFACDLTPLISLARQRTLEQNDLISKVDTKKIHAAYQLEKGLVRGVFSLISWQLIVSVCVYFVLSLLYVPFSSLLLSRLISTVNRNSEDAPMEWTSAGWALLWCGLSMIHHWAQVIFDYYCFRDSVRWRAALVASVFDHGIALRRHVPQGTASLLIGDDSRRLSRALPSVPILVINGARILCSLVMIWRFAGSWSVFALIVVAVAISPLFYLGLHFLNIGQSAALRLKDSRAEKLSLFLQHIGSVKLFAWLRVVQHKIAKLRANELKHLRTLQLSIAGLMFLLDTSIVIATFAVFSVFSGSFDSSVVFPLVNLIDGVFWPLFSLPDNLAMIAEARSSHKRISTFLNTENDFPTLSRKNQGNPSIENVSFVWPSPLTLMGETEEKHIIFDPNVWRLDFGSHQLSFPDGSLTALVGPVGSGKSALLLALLGELEMIGESTGQAPSSLFCPQQAWILNCSVAENITLGLDFNSTLFHQACYCCTLDDDIARMPGKHQTELGERGISISGGQKQRISLARVAYRVLCQGDRGNKPMLLLDDVLSAVDATTGQKIFQRLLSRTTGLFRHYTTVVSTHAISLLPNFDSICVVNQGRVQNYGSYSDLIQKGVQFEVLKSTEVVKEEEELVQEPHYYELEIKNEKKEEDSVFRTTDDETKMEEEGSVSVSVFLNFLLRSGPKVHRLLFVVVFAAEQTCNILQLLLLGSTSKPDSQFLYYFAVIVGVHALASLIRYVITAIVSIRVASSLHDKMLATLLKGSMSFFWKQPVGRLINRFVTDLGVSDTWLYDSFNDLLNTSAGLLKPLILVGMLMPLGLVALLPMICFFLWINRKHQASSIALSRLNSLSTSPVVDFTLSAFSGGPSVRAFGLENFLLSKFYLLLDQNATAELYCRKQDLWLATRSAFANVFLFGLACLLSFRAPFSPDAAGAGVILSCFASITYTLYATSFCASKFHRNLNHFERCSAVVDKTPQERGGRVPPKNWPQRGTVTFEKVTLRYTPDSLALDRVSFVVPGGKMLGVCGRTGAGKSSLCNALFQMAPLVAGKITIDGIDLQTLDPDGIRAALCVIPQDPFIMFGSSIRNNLDPQNRCADADLWEVIKKAKLSSLVNSLDTPLNSISVGQSQLVSMARALLRKSKIIVLDEPTANVDPAADNVLQAMLREQTATVITIAHRLSTILDYDYVLVMEAGRAKEFGPPSELLQNPSGDFRRMIDNSK